MRIIAEAMCVCVCIFFPFILDVRLVGRTNRGHTGGRSRRIYHPPSFCGACLNFSRENDSAVPFPRRPGVYMCVFFILTDRASTVPCNIRRRPSGTWSRRATKVYRSHHGDKPLLERTGIQTATKSLPGPTTREHRELIGVKTMSLGTNCGFYLLSGVLPAFQNLSCKLKRIMCCPSTKVTKNV